MSWVMSELGELGKWTSGGTPSRSNGKFYQGEIPWIKSGDLPDGAIRRIDESISNEAIQGSSAKVYPVGSLLVAMYGATIGKLGVTTCPAASNQACAALQASDQNRAIIPYVFYYLLSKRDALIELGQGGAQPNISQTILKALPIPVAPLTEQQRIVAALDERLSELDASVASLERAERNLVRYRAAVLAAACSGKLVPTEADLARRAGRSYEPADQLLARILAERRKANTKAKYEEPAQPDASKLPKLPEGWAWASVEQLGNGARSSAYGVLQPGDDVPNGVPFVRVGDINDGRVDGTGLKRITQAISTQYPRTLLRGQEVLITLVGTIGRTAVVPKSLKDANVARAVGVLPMGMFVDPSWVELWLRQPWSKHRLVGAAHEVARKTLNLEDVRLFPVGLPPVAEQSRILEEVDRHLSRADALAAAIAQSKRRAQRLRRAILAAAFRGRLVPQDPNDEPASVLLDRIRAEAAAAEAATASAPRRGRPPVQPAAPVATASPPAMTPKRRGRPPGSKNKAKA
jgi:type I restriction enzyme S subunit